MLPVDLDNGPALIEAAAVGQLAKHSSLVAIDGGVVRFAEAGA
jgi:hypothetical protein